MCDPIQHWFSVSVAEAIYYIIIIKEKYPLGKSICCQKNHIHNPLLKLTIPRMKPQMA